MNIQTAFDIGDRVHIDGCASIVGVITSIEVRRSDLIRYEVSWVDAGNTQFVVFDEWRLSTIGISKYPERDSEKCKLESVSQPDWQPIETAPKDGTKIVIWNKRYTFCPIASWHNSGSDDDADGWSFDDWNSPCGSIADGFVGWNEDIESGLMPTHWMPLPPPPKE